METNFFSNGRGSGAFALLALTLPSCSHKVEVASENSAPRTVSPQQWSEITSAHTSLDGELKSFIRRERHTEASADRLRGAVTGYCRLLEPLIMSCSADEFVTIGVHCSFAQIAGLALKQRIRANEPAIELDPLQFFEFRLLVATNSILSATRYVKDNPSFEGHDLPVDVATKSALRELRDTKISYPTESREGAELICIETLKRLNSKARDLFGAERWRDLTLEWR